MNVVCDDHEAGGRAGNQDKERVPHRGVKRRLLRYNLWFTLSKGERPEGEKKRLFTLLLAAVQEKEVLHRLRGFTRRNGFEDRFQEDSL